MNDLQSAKNYRALKAYSRSKLCNICLLASSPAGSAARRVTANCLHRGLSLHALVTKAGGRLRTCPESDVATTTGQYFYECLPTTPSSRARDDRSTFLLQQRSAILAGMKEIGSPPL